MYSVILSNFVEKSYGIIAFNIYPGLVNYAKNFDELKFTIEI